MSFWETLFMVGTPALVISLISGYIYGFHKALMALLALGIFIVPGIAVLHSVAWLIFAVPYVIMILAPIFIGVVIGSVLKLWVNKIKINHEYKTENNL